MSTPRILVLDIETSPLLAHVWSLWDQNISLKQVVDTTTVICFASKWLGERKIDFFSDFHHGHDVMVKEAWKRLDEADAVITYNGRAFDNKHLQREILLAGEGPPSPWQDIDLLLAVRAKFKFASSKLDHVAQQLGIGSKAETGGFELWRDCLAGDAKAWERMRRYNRRDVVLTEQLYYRILPWIKNHPNMGLFADEGRVCPKCGSSNVQYRGVTRTTASVFRRVHCQDCGAWSRTAKRVETTELRGA